MQAPGKDSKAACQNEIRILKFIKFKAEINKKKKQIDNILPIFRVVKSFIVVR